MPILASRPVTLAALLCVTACASSPPAPPAPPISPPAAPRSFQPLGTVELDLDLAAGSATARLVPPVAPGVRPAGAAGFTLLALGDLENRREGARYLSATFRVVNTSGTGFENLTLVAYHKASENLGGTALKKAVAFSGQPLTSEAAARSVKPTHGTADALEGPRPDPGRADLQFFGPEEAADLGAAAGRAGLIAPGDTVLEYGYTARSDAGGRAIAPGGSGRLTVGVRVPRTGAASTDPYRFSMTFVLADLSRPRVSRSPQESTAAAAARAAALGRPDDPATPADERAELVLVGPDSESPSNPSFVTVRLPNVRTSAAGTLLLGEPARP